MNKRINISLPTKTLEKLRSISSGKRSRFIAETLEEKLKEKKTLKESIIRDLKENRSLHEEAMKEWEGTETPLPEY